MIIVYTFAPLFKQLLFITTVMTQLHDDELFDILVGKVSTAINRTFLRSFVAEGVDITTEQWSVMACLWKEDKVTQQKLCLLTAKDKPSMTRLIDKLEKGRLVTRVADPNDRRINLIHLTSAGVALQAKATEIVMRVAQRTLSNISEDELNTVRMVLKKIMVNLK